MSVKIFLPLELFYAKENCDIYGEIQINDNNSISYFIIAHSNNRIANAADGDATSENHACERLRHLGHIVQAGAANIVQQRDVSLCFAYDEETPNIYLLKLSIKPPQTRNVNVFLYEVPKMLQLHVEPEAVPASECGTVVGEQYDDVRVLYGQLRECHHYQQRDRGQDKKKKTPNVKDIAGDLVNAPFELVTRIFIMLLEWRPLTLLLRQTVLYEHYSEWRKLRASGKRKMNIAMDKMLGLCVMLLLLFYIAHPDDYLLQISHQVIQKLRLLLQSLKGSPIGLKLNVHLNNFLLDCFNYHVDLWAKFLDLIEPIIRQLFVPIALLGSMGLSYQLALLTDLIVVIGLHAHCFYIYSAVLYKVEIKGIKVLWKVVLGKRYNVLKKRVESHNYMNRQLYLATIFFTSLLFLFPTILVYYVVFTTLRLCIYLASLLLQILRRYLLELPLQSLCHWLTGNFYDTESIQLQHMQHVPSPLLQPETTQMRMSVFKVNVLLSSLSRLFSCERGILQKFTTHEQISFKTICNRILEGSF